MKITGTTFTRRRNLAPYEHSEVVLHAEIDDATPVLAQLAELAAVAYNALHGEKPVTAENSSQVETKSLEEVPPVIPEEAKTKGKSGKASTPKAETEAKKTSAASEPATENTGKDAPVSTDKSTKGAVLYDSTIKEHRARLAAYLNTAHNGWKTKDGVLDWSKKDLQGAPFEDAKGNVLPGFKEKVASFFA